MRLAWSNLAKAELAEIRRYSINTWGRRVAIHYMQDLRDAARAVAADAACARPLRGPWRIMRVRSHYLVCPCDEGADVVMIARVLHAAMDLERHLPPEARP